MDPCPLKFAAPAVMEPTSATRSVLSVTLSGHGDFTNVKFEKSAIPVRLRADLVEVEVFYGALNFTDNYLRLGVVKSDVFPVVMGSECSGIIRRVGSDVRDFQAGEAVLCLRMQGGLLRRLVHVPPRNCFRLPSTASLIDAVALGFNSLVAHLCLFSFGRLREGQTVFMQSISGGVGSAIMQLAKTVRGVRVIGTVSMMKLLRLMARRTDKLIPHEDDYVKEILEDYPEGVDLVINSNGAVDMEKCVKLLKPFGRLVIIGSNNSVMPEKPPCWLYRRKPTWNSGNVSTLDIMRKNIAVTGVNAGEFLENSPQEAHRILDQVFHLHASRQLKPVIDNFFPPSQISKALRHLNARKNCGKIIMELRQ